MKWYKYPVKYLINAMMKLSLKFFRKLSETESDKNFLKHIIYFTHLIKTLFILMAQWLVYP